MRRHQIASPLDLAAGHMEKIDWNAISVLRGDCSCSTNSQISKN
jgi:hypothetical protein